MSDTFLASLQLQHDELEAKINEEIHRPQPDDITVHRLKKEKLAIKERIERVSAK